MTTPIDTAEARARVRRLAKLTEELSDLAYDFEAADAPDAITDRLNQAIDLCIRAERLAESEAGL